MHRLASTRIIAILVLALSLGASPISGSWAAGSVTGSTSPGHTMRLTSMAASAGLTAPKNRAIPGPYVTMLFSRTEMTAADNCTPENSGIAQIDTTVAPYLQSLGMSATGTLETGNMKQTDPLCVHYGDSLSTSWADATKLAHNYSWSFGSATATYPVRKLNHLSPAQAYAETCGSAQSIDLHGLPGGHGIIAYPGAGQVPTTVQAKDAATCFDWGRLYGDDGITPASAGKTPPYWQHTISLNGGSCHVRGQPCHNVTPGSPTGKLPHYVVPSKVIASIKALGPGQWLTFQSYVLVKGTNPAYLHNTTRWDCRSRNPQLHWTNDNERYCYNDWKRIVQAVAARPDITVTNPVTVGVAFGRPAFFLPPGAGPGSPDVQTGPLARPGR